VDPSALLQPPVAGLALLLAGAGIVSKALGGLIGARSIGRWGAVAVGMGMVPRGEVGIVVANLGLAAGLLTAATFSAVLVAVVLTTVAAPYLLAWAIPRAVAERQAAQP
ncbi:MAG TPA: cation:proton antiporter, partial [Solirubrobacterales bacterium]|nr:cation:proton antiporter [Solirubrobacterales bacterium]